MAKKTESRPLRKKSSRNIIVEHQEGCEDNISVLSTSMAGDPDVGDLNMDESVRATKVASYHYNSDSDDDSHLVDEEDADYLISRDDDSEAEHVHRRAARTRKRRKIVIGSLSIFMVTAIAGAGITYFAWVSRPHGSAIHHPESRGHSASTDGNTRDPNIVHERPITSLHEDLQAHCPSRDVLEQPSMHSICVSLCKQSSCCDSAILIGNETNSTDTETGSLPSSNSTNTTSSSNSAASDSYSTTCLGGNETLCRLVSNDCHTLFPTLYPLMIDAASVDSRNTTSTPKKESASASSLFCATIYDKTSGSRRHQQLRQRFLEEDGQEIRDKAGSEKDNQLNRSPELLNLADTASHTNMLCHPDKISCLTDDECAIAATEVDGVQYKQCVSDCSATPPDPIQYCSGALHAAKLHPSGGANIVPEANVMSTQHKERDHFVCDPDRTECQSDLDCMDVSNNGIKFVTCSSLCEAWEP
jgi:hypothetical protein